MTFLEMLAANGYKTWAETLYRPSHEEDYKPNRAFSYTEEEMTPEQQEARIQGIRLRITRNQGMDTAVLLNKLINSHRFSGLELRVISERCFHNTGISTALQQKLKQGGIFTRAELHLVAQRLRIGKYTGTHLGRE